MAFTGKCPKCGQELKDSKFCFKCGENLMNINEAESSAKEDYNNEENYKAQHTNQYEAKSEPAANKGTKSINIKKSYIKIGVIALVAICFVFGGFKIYNFYEKKNSTPQNVARTILKAWKDKDFEKVYSYIDASKLSNTMFLTEKDFVEAMENNKLTEYSLNITEDDQSYLSTVNYNVSLVINSKSIDDTLVLEKKVTSNNSEGKWYIDPGYFTIDVPYSVPKGAELSINGNVLKSTDDNNTQNINVFAGSQLKVEFKGPIIKPEVKTVSACSGVSEINMDNLKVQVSDDIKTKIVSLIKDVTILNNKFTKQLPKSEIEKLVARDTDAWNYYMNLYTDYAYLPDKITNAVLQSMKIETGDSISAEVKESGEFNGEYTVNYSIKVDPSKNVKLYSKN